MSVRPSARLRFVRATASILTVVGIALLASACVTKGKYEELASELEQNQVQLANAQGEIDAAAAVTQDLEAQIEAKEVALAATTATYSALAEDLEQELVAGQVQIEQLRDGIRVQLSSDVLFASGSAELDERGREVVASVSDELASAPYRIEVEGHTDNEPIGPTLAKTYQTNWELAAARASRVVDLLQKNGVGPERLVAVSYGDTRPVAPNDSAEGRKQNRRIEVRLTPATDGTPGVSAPPSEPAEE